MCACFPCPFTGNTCACGSEPGTALTWLSTWSLGASLSQQADLFGVSHGMQAIWCQGMVYSQPRMLLHVRVLGTCKIGMRVIRGDE